MGTFHYELVMALVCGAQTPLIWLEMSVCLTVSMRGRQARTRL